MNAADAGRAALFENPQFIGIAADRENKGEIKGPFDGGDEHRGGDRDQDIGGVQGDPVQDLGQLGQVSLGAVFGHDKIRLLTKPHFGQNRFDAVDGFEQGRVFHQVDQNDFGRRLIRAAEIEKDIGPFQQVFRRRDAGLVQGRQIQRQFPAFSRDDGDVRRRLTQQDPGGQFGQVQSVAVGAGGAGDEGPGTHQGDIVGDHGHALPLAGLDDGRHAVGHHVDGHGKEEVHPLGQQAADIFRNFTDVADGRRDRFHSALLQDRLQKCELLDGIGF